MLIRSLLRTSVVSRSASRLHTGHSTALSFIRQLPSPPRTFAVTSSSNSRMADSTPSNAAGAVAQAEQLPKEAKDTAAPTHSAPADQQPAWVQCNAILLGWRVCLSAELTRSLVHDSDPVAIDSSSTGAAVDTAATSAPAAGGPAEGGGEKKGPSKSELKKREKEAEKERKRIEREAKEAAQRAAKEAADVVRCSVLCIALCLSLMLPLHAVSVPAGLRHPELRSAATAPVTGAARCADYPQPNVPWSGALG